MKHPTIGTTPVRPSLTTLLALLLALCLFSLVGVTPAAAATETNINIPYDLTIFVPCAAGGAGEVVVLSGSLHVLFFIEYDASGGVIHGKLQFNPQSVNGVGLTTGDRYQGTGVQQMHFNGVVGSQFTSLLNFQIIGQGPGNNILVHQQVHTTINANGTVTAALDNLSLECR